MAALGAVPQRARVGHGARGLQRDGDAWDFFPHDHARSRAYRWNEDGLGRHLRRPPDALLRARVLERARPDPEGADLRAHRARGQPRRGRQGVLVVPRLDADALVDALALHVPAGRVPVRATSSTRTAPRASSTPSSSWSTPASSTTAATGRSPPTTRRRRRRTCCVRVSVRNAGPEPATIDVLPTLWFRNTWSWGIDGTQAVDPARGRRCSSPSTTSSAPRVLAARRLAGGPVLRERDEPRAAVRRRERTPYPKDGINDHVVHGAADRQPAADRHEGRAALPARRSPPARRRRSGCASARPRDRERTTFDAIMRAARAPRPTSSTPS